MGGLAKKLFSGIGLSTIAIAASTFYLSYRLVHPKRRIQEKTPRDFGLNYRPIEFFSSDKIKLKGWLIKNKNPKGIIILSHGYGYDKQSMLPPAKELYENGYSLLLFDYRAHGESEGNKTTIGFLEQYDLLAAIDFARKLNRRIAVIGVSMGAATAIVVGAKTKNIKAIVADSSFAKLKDIIYSKIPLLSQLIIKFMSFHGVDVSQSQPLNNVNKLSIPILYIHSKKDTLIPYQESIKLFNKTKSEKKILLFPEGDHGRSYFVKNNGYSNTVINFLDKYLVKSS